MKGQVSFFVIIGVLAVVAVLAGLLIFSVESPSVKPQDNTPDFVNLRSCVDSEFRDTLVLSALNGGILSMSSDQLTKSAYFEPMIGYQFPLWNKNSITYIPTRENMQSNISSHLTSRIHERCLVESNIDPRTVVSRVSVTLSETRNIAEVSYEGEFISANSRNSIPSMRLENDLPFLKNYNAAQSLATELLSSGILVGINQNIIELTPDIPTSGTDFSCSTKQWRTSDVQNSFVSSLESYVPYLRFNNVPSVSSDIASKHFTFSLAPLAGNNNINVRANYQKSFGIKFDAEKSQGDLMTSFVTMNPETPGICQNHYSFWYSVEYPVLINIEDTSSSIPFQFRMALYNEVFRNQLEEPPTASLIQTGYCSDTTFRKSDFDVIDDQGNQILGVFAKITCGSEECVIRNNQNGLVNDYLPRRCIRGTITFEKQGYETKTLSYNSNSFNDYVGEQIVMSKLREIQLEFTGEEDLSSFMFILESDGKWVTFDNNRAYLPRTANNNRLRIMKTNEIGNLENIGEPFVLSANNNIKLTIRSNFLIEGSYSNMISESVIN